MIDLAWFELYPPRGLDLDAVTGFVEARKVIGNLFPVGDGAIVAGIETQH